ncbi:MAG: GntR family transcriptional regulator, partial [Angustibacter sp.]
MAGKLVPGDPIPSERLLAESWSVSRMTASKALGSLRSEGLIVSIQGKGTFVTVVPQITAGDRYGRSINPLGKSYGPHETSEIRKIELKHPEPDIADFLRLKPGADAILRY